MYQKNASLDYLLINMVVNAGIPDKYIAITAPDLMKWVPILLTLYMRMPLPMKQTTA
jgi:hypothetical protein